MSHSIFARFQAGWRRLRQRSMLLALMLLLTQHAYADLMLYPTRIVFEKNQRAAQIELINDGAKAATYRLSVVNRRMSETGEFLPVETAMPGELFSEPMLRFSPRQITLQPGTAQTVRVILRKPAALADGEYRSHLQFDRLPDTEGSTSVESAPSDNKEIGVTIRALVGASVPVIVRHGATSATVELSHLELTRTGAHPGLSLQVERSGNSSVYGDLEVTFTPDGGAPQALARMGGMAVYVPNPVRKTVLELKPPPGMALSHGTLRVSYRQRAEAGGGLMAQASLVLP